MTIRFGVVGTAHWARSVHVPGLLATPGVELCGIHGRNAREAHAIASTHGLRAFANFDEMLDCVDAVTIAVPPAAQPVFAVAAARRGKHLLLEKPIASALRDAESIRDAVAAGGVSAIVYFTRRYVTGIEDAIQDASRQSWKQASVRVFSSAMSTASPYAGSVWRKENGAELWDTGPHVLSILIPILGTVTRVSAHREPRSISRVVTDHASGATAESSMSLNAKPEDAMRQIALIADSRRIEIPYPDIDFVRTFSAAAAELVSMIESGTRTHRCDVGFGLEVVNVLDAADRSLEMGRPVEVQSVGIANPQVRAGMTNDQ